MGVEETLWRPLGELLVEKSVISATELEAALLEQAETGERLGEILIARGYSSRPAIQDSLAEQSGVMFEPERGFGTGLRGLLAKKHEDTRRAAQNGGPARGRLAAVMHVHRHLEPVAAPEPEPEVEIEPESESAPEPELVGSEAVREALATAEDAVHALTERLAQREADMATERPHLEVEEQVVDEVVEEQLDAGDQSQNGDSGASANGGHRHPTVEEVEAATPAPGHHLRLVPGPSGYDLQLHEGPAPLVGEQISAGERFALVVKLGPSPLPGDERVCAYLLAE